MRNKNKTITKQKKLIGMIFFTLVLGVFFVARPAMAGEITGWVGSWTDDGNMTGLGTNPAGFGWLSMNGDSCDADQNGFIDSGLCGGDNVATAVRNYAVKIPATGDFIEPSYAWSPNIGWISFNKAALAGCPEADQANCSARRSGDNLEGWARILSIRNAGSNAGGWGGWIKLRHAGSSGAKTCQSGSKSGETCSDDVDCAETAECNASSGGVGWAFVASRLYECPGTIQYGEPSEPEPYFVCVGDCSLDGLAQRPWITDNDAFQALFLGNGSCERYGYYQVGCEVRLVGPGAPVGTYRYCKKDAEYSCPLSGGSACSGNPPACSKSYTCAGASGSSAAYGVSIVDSTKGKGLGGSANCGSVASSRNNCGYAWSNEIGWLKFDPELVYFKLPTVILSADPTLIPIGPGQTVSSSSPIKNGTTLTWIVSGADRCEAEGAWSGNKNNTDGTEKRDLMSGTNTFTLKCYNGDASATASATVNAYCNKPVCKQEDGTCDKNPQYGVDSYDNAGCNQSECSNNFQCQSFEWQEKSPN